MKTESRDFIEACIESLIGRTEFLIQKIDSSDKELHFYKAEVKALNYALTLMRHELGIRQVIEQRLKDRNPTEGMNV